MASSPGLFGVRKPGICDRWILGPEQNHRQRRGQGRGREQDQMAWPDNVSNVVTNSLTVLPQHAGDPRRGRCSAYFGEGYWNGNLRGNWQ